MGIVFTRENSAGWAVQKFVVMHGSGCKGEEAILQDHCEWISRGAIAFDLPEGIDGVQGESEVSLASGGTAIRSFGSSIASARNGVGEELKRNAELNRKGNGWMMLERSQGRRDATGARSGLPCQGCWYYQHTPCGVHNSRNLSERINCMLNYDLGQCI
jgi:hypothetical protein